MNTSQAYTVCLCLLLLSVLTLSMGSMAQTEQTGMNDKYLNKITQTVELEVSGWHTGKGEYSISDSRTDEILITPESSKLRQNLSWWISQSTEVIIVHSNSSLANAEKTYKAAIEKMNRERNGSINGSSA
jgi:hypothetical protein